MWKSEAQSWMWHLQRWCVLEVLSHLSWCPWCPWSHASFQMRQSLPLRFQRSPFALQAFTISVLLPCCKLISILSGNKISVKNLLCPKCKQLSKTTAWYFINISPVNCIYIVWVGLGSFLSLILSDEEAGWPAWSKQACNPSTLRVWGRILWDPRLA